MAVEVRREEDSMYMYVSGMYMLGGSTFDSSHGHKRESRARA